MKNFNEVITTVEDINQMVRDIARKETELREKILAKSVEENDFLVGSPILKAELEEMFKGMRVSYSPYVDENTIIMIKKAIVKPLEFYEKEQNDGTR